MRTEDVNIVDLDRVTKYFGSVVAVDELDLHLAPGVAVAILGPNGAGKTTTISLMLGLRKPTKGTVRLVGLNPRDLRARTMCGVMLQASGVPTYLKVREAIDLFRTYYPAPLGINSVLETAGLIQKRNAVVASLSGGELQRLYFALAIAGDPQVLFLDEPSVGLDVEARHALWDALRAIKESGKTIVMTTHYLEEADMLAQRVVIVNQGKIIADGAPSAIKARVGGKRLSFSAQRVLGSDDWAGLPVQQCSVLGNGVTMLSAQPEVVLKALFERGLDIRNLEVAGASLEEAFLALTDAPSS